ncbi:MAG: cytochrome c [Chloroflexi bacterium]|nr:cytochrome c [Chloroflexota bacterium]
MMDPGESNAPAEYGTPPRWWWPAGAYARVLALMAAAAVALAFGGGAFVVFIGANAGAASGGGPGAIALEGGDPSRGREAYRAGGCAECHGPQGEGGRFPGAPRVVGTALHCEQLWQLVRRPPNPAKGMPPFSVEQVSDANLRDICAWAHAGR